MRPLRAHAPLLAGAVAVALALPAPLKGAQLLAQSTPRLPSGGSYIAPLKRGADGQLEPINPTKPATPSGPSLCSPETLCVGPGQAYPSLSAAADAARPGDVIEVVGGTYGESVVLKAPRLTVRGIKGRAHFDCDGVALAWDKACLVLAGPDITLENLEISGAVISHGKGGNGACVRNEPDRSFTLRKIVCHSSQDGVLTNGGAVVIENSEFYDNGWDGGTHNAYFSGACDKVTVRNSIFRDARVGHEFKSRCRETEIVNTTFHAVRGSRALDISDGGLVTIEGGTIIQEPGVQNSQMIGYAPEHCNFPKNEMTVSHVRFVGKNANGAIVNFGKCPDATIRLLGDSFDGHRPKVEGKVVFQ